MSLTPNERREVLKRLNKQPLYVFTDIRGKRTYNLNYMIKVALVRREKMAQLDKHKIEY